MPEDVTVPEEDAKRKPRPRVRANREGTIYERVKTVGGRTYVYHVAEVEFTDEHDRVRRLRAERTTKTRALAALQELRDEVRAGRVPEPEVARRTVTEVLERWLADAERRGLRPATLRSYRHIVEQHLVPRIGTKRAVALRRRDIDTMLDSMADGDGKVDDKVGDRTRQLSYVVAKMALSQHVVCKPEEHPFPRRGGPRVEKRTMKVWSEEQVRCFLHAARGDRHEALYVVAIATGARQGEILGLRWSDVHDNHVTIRTSLDQHERELAPTKTLKSRRPIHVSAAVIATLTRHKAKEKRAGRKVTSDDLVFQNEVGEPIHASNLYRRSFKPLVADAKVPLIRFHDLRHTFATLLLTRGVHVKIVSEMLGHASIQQTLDTYSHVLPSLQRAAVDATADLFLPKRRKGRSPAKLPGKKKSGGNRSARSKRKTPTK
jgi:integrase